MESLIRPTLPPDWSWMSCFQAFSDCPIPFDKSLFYFTQPICFCCFQVSSLNDPQGNPCPRCPLLDPNTSFLE